MIAINLSTSHSYNEPELLLRIAEGDQTSFKILVDTYWQKVYGFALAYTKSLPLAEEVTQDVFMDIWNSRERLSSLENFANFLFIVTRNRVFKVVRKKLQNTVNTDDVNMEEDIWLPDQQLELQEMYSLILKGIDQLPPVRKQVFTLSRLEGLSYDQISQQLNLSRNTVKEHIVKALNSLRAYLALHDSRIVSVFVYFTASALLVLYQYMY